MRLSHFMLYVLCSLLLLPALRLPAQDDITSFNDTSSTVSETPTDEEYYEEEEYTEEVSPTKARDQYFADTINVKHFDKKQWEKIVNGQTFTEEEEEAGNSPSFNMPSMPFNISSQLVKILGILLLVGLIGFILYKLLKNLSLNRRKAQADDAVVAIDNLEERLPEKDVLMQLLKDALAKGDYKTAIRYYYLMMIAHFRQKGWIVWTKDKTNRHYLKEMRNNSLYGDMKAATHLFERYWYGDNDPGLQGFTNAEVLFKRLLNS